MTVSNVNVSAASIGTFVFNAAGGETSVSGVDANGASLSYIPGKEQVYINGVLLVRGSDYVATTGNSITGLSALIAGDVVLVLAFSPFSVATAIPSTTVTAKGDLVVASSSGNVTNLPVGSDGSTLLADSSTSTGLRWQPNFAAGKNKIINGDFNIWQRGTSFTIVGTDAYTADRWIVSSGAGGTCTATQQSFTPGSAPVAGYEGKTFLQVSYSVSGTSTVGLAQKIEDVRTFAGQTVTISFWARVTSGTFAGVGPDLVQFFGSSGSSAVVNTSSNPSVTLTTTWQRFSFVFTLPSISGKTISGGNDALWARINLGTTGTNTFQYWGFQVEAGNTATAFQTATGTLQGELAACQRYYFKVDPGQLAVSFSTTACYVSIPYSMRTSPSVSASAVLKLDRFGVGSYTQSTTDVSAPGASQSNNASLIIIGSFSGLTANQGYQVRTDGGSILLSAEL